MRERKRTGWYPPSITPLADRPGWYERDWSTAPYLEWWNYRDWWDGERWRDKRGGVPLMEMYLPWRGLTAPAGDGKGAE